MIIRTQLAFRYGAILNLNAADSASREGIPVSGFSNIGGSNAKGIKKNGRG